MAEKWGVKGSRYSQCAGKGRGWRKASQCNPYQNQRDDDQPGTAIDIDAVAFAIGSTGCFIAGTQIWIDLPRPISSADVDGRTTPLVDTTFESIPTTIPIEEVALGQRVPTRNPASDQRYEVLPRPNYTGWKVIRMENRHLNGSIVDVQLLRSEDWIERNGFHVGATINLHLTEIEVNADGSVLSIGDGPEILPGEGAVVIGRFLTREGSGLVSVTFEDGTRLLGTRAHPVWSPSDRQWRGLGEFEPGQFVQARSGTVMVVSVEELAGHPRLYNIEIDGEHVYEVTAIGVLVHNGNPVLCKELLELKALAKKGPLTPEQAKQLTKLEAEAAALTSIPMQKLTGELRGFFPKTVSKWKNNVRTIGSEITSR